MSAMISAERLARLRTGSGYGLALLLVLGLPMLLADFYVSLFNYIGIYSLVCLGLVLLTGIGGLTSFGQAAFVGIGAYSCAYFTTVHAVDPWFSLLLGLLLTGVSAWVLGHLTLRLSGHYLSLATLAWGISLYYLFGNLASLGGHSGISGIPVLSLFHVELSDKRYFFVIIWLVVLLNLVLLRNLLDSRCGRAIRALKNGAGMAESFGIDTARTKLAIFIQAALLASLAGWLYAQMQRFVNPTPFSINMGIEFLFMVVVGGAGHLWGALLGATLITVLKEWLQDWLPALFGQSGNYEGIVFGVLILLMLLLARNGLWPLLMRHLPRAPRATPPTAAVEALPRRPQPLAGEPLLQVKGAVKRFGGLVAVNDLSFEVNAGEIVGLLGPNGAGKSTLFNLISGVLPVSNGHIHFRGQRIDRLPSRAILRLGMARTFQHVQLLADMSVLENVALGAYCRTRSGMGAAMLRLDRDEEARVFQEAEAQLRHVGLEQEMHASAGSLALGKQRIVEIARALAADPVLLLLDEPAAGLRRGEKQELARLLSRLREEGTSVLIVEHDMEFIMQLADRLVVMEFGQKLAEGSAQQVRQNPAVLDAYLGGVQ